MRVLIGICGFLALAFVAIGAPLVGFGVMVVGLLLWAASRTSAPRPTVTAPAPRRPHISPDRPLGSDPTIQFGSTWHGKGGKTHLKWRLQVYGWLDDGNVACEVLDTTVQDQAWRGEAVAIDPELLREDYEQE